MKNEVKFRILLVWDAPQSFWSDSELKLQDSGRQIRFRAQKIGSQAKKYVLKDFAGKFGALFFIWFGYKIDAPICCWLARTLGDGVLMPNVADK